MRTSRSWTTRTTNAMSDPRATRTRIDRGTGPDLRSMAPTAPAVDHKARVAELERELMSALAEQENIRKRMRRERDEAVKRAVGCFAGELLDTFERLNTSIEDACMDAGKASAASLIAGVRASEYSLLSALARHGVRRIDPIEQRFDPREQQAVYLRIETTVSEGTVVEVLQPGYLLHDRLVRPAIVAVAAADNRSSDHPKT